MARGGSKNGNNSPIIGDNGVIATPDELRALTRNMLDNFRQEVEKPPVDLHNKASVIQAIEGYFIDCERSGKRPGNMGLYRALGISRQDYNNIMTGKSKSKVNPACIDILKKATHLLGEYREQLGATGKLNPATLIFWQKNYDNLTDTTYIELSADANQRAQLSPEEIAKQIEQDIPIDADYKESDN